MHASNKYAQRRTRTIQKNDATWLKQQATNAKKEKDLQNLIASITTSYNRSKIKLEKEKSWNSTYLAILNEQKVRYGDEI